MNKPMTLYGNTKCITCNFNIRLKIKLLFLDNKLLVDLEYVQLPGLDNKFRLNIQFFILISNLKHIKF